MLNEIKRISISQYATILDNAKKRGVYIAEINGENINNMDDYLKAVWKVFSFPKTGHVNYYAYLDWIRDLDWLSANAYIFTIRNFKTFMEKSQKEREIILKSLENTVLTWWNSEIEKFQVGGKAKSFNVYLID